MLFSTLPVGLAKSAYYKAVYATIVVSNIGAFLTPIGALAGIMFTKITATYGEKIGVGKFIACGAAVSLPALAASLAALELLLP